MKLDKICEKHGAYFNFASRVHGVIQINWFSKEIPRDFYDDWRKNCRIYCWIYWAAFIALIVDVAAFV